jgi:adenosyl cobinamide kinase/adenosyl cobinamide phosphate guanylyltransferase
MMLVTGGVASGKRTFVRSLGFAEEDFSRVPGNGVPVLVDAQELARGQVTPGLLDALARKDVVIITEVGSGVVPLDAGERAWRERAGRLACQLAARAACVVRMVCGVPQVLKGDPQEALR